MALQNELKTNRNCAHKCVPWSRNSSLLTSHAFATRNGLAQTLPLNVCDAAKAQFGGIVPIALTCPFGTSQTLHIGVCAIREWSGWGLKPIVEKCFWANKARMSMKTKDNDNLSGTSPMPLTPETVKRTILTP
jgi:hypothetical protein